MEISRRTIAKALITVFVLNLIVMGVGAYYSVSNHTRPRVQLFATSTVRESNRSETFCSFRCAGCDT